MTATGKMEDPNLSEKMVEVKEDLRTIECLRGRLLAERQASKVGNENAEQMSSKLIELENQLKEETKLRNKAEKKLRFLKKKLESLNISIPLDESEQSSSSSDICSHSCKSSTTTTTTTTTSGLKDSEESESKPQITTPQVSQNLDNNLSESASIQENSSEHSSPSCEDSKPDDYNKDSEESESKPQITTPQVSQNLDNNLSESASIQENSSEHSSPSCEDSKPDDYNSMKAEMEAENESDKEDYSVDNSLALVPVSNPIPDVKSESNEVKKIIISGNVRDALDALRLAREMIQSSMESRHMIRAVHS